MKNYIKYMLTLCLCLTLFWTTAALAEESSSAPDPSGSSAPSQGRWSITKIEKPYPCFVNGTIRKEDLLARLPQTVTVTVEKPVGQFQTRSAKVEWNTKNIPSVVDVGKAFIINGEAVDSALEAEGITGGSRSVSIHVITAPSGPVSTLRGKARIVTDLETEVELYLICPEAADGFYIEYSTDQQEWKSFRNGANLWPELTDPDTKRIRPEDIRNNGEITMTYRLELLRGKAASGFWLRIRLEGSEHEGTSNVCYFKPADKSGESTWKPGSDSGSGGGWDSQSFGNEAGAAGGEGLGESGEESESEEGEETKPSEEETKRRRRSSGDTSTEEPTEEPTEPTQPTDDGEKKGNSSGGYAARGYSSGGYGIWEDEEEEEPKKKPWILKLGAAAAIIGGISLAGYLAYRRFTKEDEN